MISKEKRLKNCKLYLVLDTEVDDYRGLLKILRQVKAKGVDIVQLRDKKGTAHNILEFARAAQKILNKQIPFIINDRVDLALIAKADGVHLGQEDLSICSTRRMMGSKAIIGASCQTLAHALKAQKEGADYIGFGSVFKTKTKPGRQPMDLKLLSRVAKGVHVPTFAIGGIDLSNVGLVRSSGIKRIALTRAIILSRNAGETTAGLKKFLTKDLRVRACFP